MSLSLSCADDKTTITFNEVNITTDDNSLVEIYVPKAIGNDMVSNKINTKINELLITSLAIGDSEAAPSSSVEESVSRFNNEYKSFKADFPESPVVWEAQIDGEVTYQSDAIISLAITNYQNTGGAHGNVVINFLNFDALTGDSISNSDLFSDFSALESLAKDHFYKEISDKKEDYFEPDNFILPANMGLNDEGLILLYNTYEIAPYSSGITEIHIPFSEIETLLNYK